MLETINTVSQTVRADGQIGLGNVSVKDYSNRITLGTNGNIIINEPGKYKINALFNVYNSTSSPVNISIQMYANDNAVNGTLMSTTVPETGYSEINIQKVIKAIPSSYGDVIKIEFITSTGATINTVVTDVFKRS